VEAGDHRTNTRAPVWLGLTVGVLASATAHKFHRIFAARVLTR